MAGIGFELKKAFKGNSISKKIDPCSLLIIISGGEALVRDDLIDIGHERTFIPILFFHADCFHPAAGGNGRQFFFHNFS